MQTSQKTVRLSLICTGWVSAADCKHLVLPTPEICWSEWCMDLNSHVNEVVGFFYTGVLTTTSKSDLPYGSSIHWVVISTATEVRLLLCKVCTGLCDLHYPIWSPPEKIPYYTVTNKHMQHTSLYFCRWHRFFDVTFLQSICIFQ